MTLRSASTGAARLLVQEGQRPGGRWSFRASLTATQLVRYSRNAALLLCISDSRCPSEKPPSVTLGAFLDDDDAVARIIDVDVEGSRVPRHSERAGTVTACATSRDHGLPLLVALQRRLKASGYENGQAHRLGGISPCMPS